MSKIFARRISLLVAFVMLFTTVFSNLTIVSAETLEDAAVVISNEEGSLETDLDDEIEVVQEENTEADLEDAAIVEEAVEAADSEEIASVEEEVEATTEEVAVLNENVETNDFEVNVSVAGKIDVWDFGAAELDESTYTNLLTKDVINGLFPGIAAGTANQTIGTFTVGDLSYVTTSVNNRIRTSNTALTRYDNNNSDKTIGGEELHGCYFVNGSCDKTKYLKLENVKKDDIISFYGSSDNADSKLHFVNDASPTEIIKSETLVLTGNVQDVIKFYAPADGTYRIYCEKGSSDRMRVYRLTREASKYAKLSGNVTCTDSMPVDSKVLYKNLTTGFTYEAPIADGKYSFDALPAGFTYSASLKDARGFVISVGTIKELGTEDATNDITVQKVALNTLSGKIEGISAAQAAKTKFIFTPVEDKIFQAELVLNGDSYSVDLEPNLEYTLTIEDLNDYETATKSVKITADKVENLVFTAKPTYAVTVKSDILDASATTNVKFTFTNVKETRSLAYSENASERAYAYTFTYAQMKAGTAKLRDGVYETKVEGLSGIAYGLNSAIEVAGKDATKEYKFTKSADVKWNFADADYKAVWDTAKAYKGLVGEGNTLVNKDYLLLKNGGSVKIPAKVGQKIKAEFYYAANAKFDGETQISIETGSTQSFEYFYKGTEDGYVTIAAAGDTYLTYIETVTETPYSKEIYVGKDKQYKTVNAALNAVKKMKRDTATQNVTIVIDPGDYEEMLVVDIVNITLKNAAGRNASIALNNKGAGIEPTGVRITGYYGHGLSYYSMNSSYLYDEEVLKVNKENAEMGYNTCFANPGAGSATFWNATVIVKANKFRAEGIIFENSFNQYTSKKQSEDVLVMESGYKGAERSKVVGDTTCQDKAYVERAAALGLANSISEIVFDNCRFVGRQDTLYGGTAKAYFNKCAIMGGTDYIFGPMTAVFNRCDLVFNTMETATDVGYITAAQQSAGVRGYFFNSCTVKSTTPGVDTASQKVSKPGYLGRPWATSSETIFFNTKVEASSVEGKSLIEDKGWSDTLSGQANVYEYNTMNPDGSVMDYSGRVNWTKDGSPLTHYITDKENLKLADGKDIAEATIIPAWNPNVERSFIGDIDNDGKLGANDITSVLDATINGFVNFSEADLSMMDYNKDGKVRVDDVIAIMQASLLG